MNYVNLLNINTRFVNLIDYVNYSTISNRPELNISPFLPHLGLSISNDTTNTDNSSTLMFSNKLDLEWDEC